jgi:DNA (cytosine-5)-methyltransferase 1
MSSTNEAQPTGSFALPALVSLFSGAGGLDKGFVDEGFSVAVAMDISLSAIRTHRRNFPSTRATQCDIAKLGPRGVVELVKNCVPPGTRIGVIGGPPCQGFSRANNASVADDPRNQLPALYVEIVAALRKDFIVEFVVFENVMGIRDRKHEGTFQAVLDGLRVLGLKPSEHRVVATDFGVPQTRNRLVLVGVRECSTPILIRERTGHRTVRDAIAGLPEPDFYRSPNSVDSDRYHPNHWTMQPKSKRFQEPDSLASSGRSFRRLNWDEPSPTVAYGHREIHVHPDGTRRLSIYEAMRLQGFDSDFVIEGNLSEQVEQISNAVPPPLARSIAAAVAVSLNQRDHGNWFRVSTAS